MAIATMVKWLSYQVDRSSMVMERTCTVRATTSRTSNTAVIGKMVPSMVTVFSAIEMVVSMWASGSTIADMASAW